MASCGRRRAILCAFILASWTLACGQITPEQACPNALKAGQPNCQNGGTLYFENKDQTHSTSCAHCNCPDQWRGTDCSICKSIDSCPPIKVNNETLHALACTNDAIIPNSEEMIVGKKISCTCGGDAFSDFACMNQPDLNMLVDLTGDLSKGMAVMNVKQFSGMPNQAAPCTKDACYPKKRYEYAYPQAWEADFLRCKSVTEDCQVPLNTKQKCLVIECETSDVSCPPKSVPKCPEFSTTSPYCAHFKCENATQCPPEGTSDYWQHHCYEKATPPQNSSVTFRCMETPTESDERFHCAFSYANMNFPTFIGLKCSVGNCIYQKPGPPPAPPPYVPPDHVPTHIPHLILMLCCSLLSFAFVGIIIRDQKQRDTLPKNLIPYMLPTSKENDLMMEDRLLLHEKTRNYISWKNLTCTSSSFLKVNNMPLLSNASGWAGHLMDGNGLTAIMGPSGAGKTTLLDAISGRAKSIRVQGEVRLNGWIASPKQLRAISGFVMQDDILPGTSTVWEYFMFNAMLRMPQRLRKEYKRQRVFEIIQQLGLTKVAMSLIGDEFVRGLSGGEKRRLSIGVEILVCPPVLFLDEPLSGLDSSNAGKVMSTLGDIAASGIAVVLTLHQPRPDMLLTIDRLMVLSAGGCTVYSGPTSQLESYLGEIGHTTPESMTPVDFLLELLVNSDDFGVSGGLKGFCDEVDFEVEESFRSSRGEDLWEALNDRVPFLVQMQMLSGRSLRSIYRNKYTLFVNFFLTFIVAISVGTIFFNSQNNTGGIQNRFGSIFFILLYLGMTSLGLLPIWREQWILFLKENASGTYSSFAYFLNMVVYEVILTRLIPPMFFAVFSYWMISLNDTNGFSIFLFTLVLILTNIAASSMSILVGQLSTSNAVSNVIGTMATLIFVVFGGFFLNKNTIPVGLQWLANISFFNYAYEVLVVNEFHYTNQMFNFTAPLTNQSVTIPTSGDGILEVFGFDWRRLPSDLVILVIIIGVILCMTYMVLFLKVKRAWNNHISSPSYHEDDSRADDVRLAPNLPYTLHGKNDRDSHLLADNSQNIMVDLRAEYLILSWTKLCCSTFDKQGVGSIVQHASGLAMKYAMTAIMGPSGAGKSTLLDAISGRAKSVRVQGEVRLNGWIASPKQLRAISGFVMQDDILPGTSTVWEYFMFNAMLRMPQRLRKEYKRQRVFEIIQQLGLTKVAMSLIGDEFVRGLSGGEKRRLSIGVEILVCPPVLFLDEPLSGLDSSNAGKVMSTLGDIAASGIAVVLTLHQPRPDMLLTIDRLMVLSAGGCTVYSGPTSQLESYLSEIGHTTPESMTPVDFLLELLVDSTEVVVAKITESYSKSVLMADEMKQLDQLVLNTNQTASSIPAIARSCSAVFEFGLLLKRAVIANARSPLLITLNLVSSLLIAFSVGFIFKDAGTDTSGIQMRMGSLFFILLYLSMISLGSIPVWHQEHRIFLKEHSSGLYRIWTYFLAVVVNEFVLLRSLPPVAFCWSYYLIKLRGEAHSSHMVTFVTCLVLCNCTLTGIVFIIGAATRKTSLANVLGSVVMLLSTLFAGYLLNKSDMSRLISLLSHLSPLEYAFQILLVNEFHGLPKGYFHFTDPSDKHASGIAVSGDTILVTFGFFPGGNGNNYITLAGILAASLVASFFLLKSGTFKN
ncbi:ABC transporter [Chloropicon primus]|uniref:ABC transporter n=1 Tax=Chloropicon primus TaxID=1764295 RepID=A0A5B8MT37_9CHLO|nr:ABC transporter [Chloropicon primus]|eukprot:QDZ23693.1 ABC transporter [Chloropicon primus]